MVTTNKSLIHKFFTSDIKTIDESEGIVEAYVNSMGVVDHDGEVIDFNAFDKSIDKGGQSVAWFHDQSSPVGKVIDSAPIELAYGDDDEEFPYRKGKLKAIMQFNLNTQRGREAFADVQFGSVKEWSVGFRSLDDNIERLPNGDNVRVIKALDWVEVSPVMRGASPDTQTIISKSATVTETSEKEETVTVTDKKKLKLEIQIAKTKLDINLGKSKQNIMEKNNNG
tara:strand:- start:1033 stop:1707 length:675 start_codon:yes stop_codon:yes gene_type:complete